MLQRVVHRGDDVQLGLRHWHRLAEVLQELGALHQALKLLHHLAVPLIPRYA